jgi:hypothetical protein
MINISSATPVSWPTPPSTAVAPVSPAMPVKPVQAGGRETQTDGETRRDARLPQPRAGAPRQPGAEAADAPPLLPREAAAGAQGPDATQARQDAVAQRAEQALKKAEADKANHRKAMERLQDVLSSMWAASAAVVDQALGREPNAGDLPGSQSDTAPDLSAVAASTISRRQAARLADAVPTPQGGEAAAQGMTWPVMPPATEEAAAPGAPEVPGGEVVAYDEHGNSSLAPLEAGSIISERV